MNDEINQEIPEFEKDLMETDVEIDKNNSSDHLLNAEMPASHSQCSRFKPECMKNL